ncbi:MAG: tetratricopeptide repeat protein [bacterium]|nr:tetratricopeptide repeat protein [bacterium]
MVNTMSLGYSILLIAATSLAAALPPPEHQTAKVQAKRFEVAYRANQAALPLSRVDLWYSRDSGATWHNYGIDDDAQSPIQFSAEQEGLYGFYVVMANPQGSSGPAPAPGTAPHEWAFVDYTPPIVQVHPVRKDAPDGVRPRLQIRWTAIDAFFSPRPIELEYRVAPDGEWNTLADRLSNTGRYDWIAPEHLVGRVVIRVTARDRGGHRVSAVASAVEIAPISVPEPDSAPPAEHTKPDPLSGTDRERAEALFRRGLMHKEAGEFRVAAARFQDALAIAPQYPEALVNLGETLYLQNQHTDAIKAYEWGVRLEPEWVAARRGLVRVLMMADRYEAASAHLAHLLEQSPTDAESWLTLGDVAMSRGDELMAREHWHKAATVDAATGKVIERAQARLDSLQRVAVLAGPARD